MKSKENDDRDLMGGLSFILSRKMTFKTSRPQFGYSNKYPIRVNPCPYMEYSTNIP